MTETMRVRCINPPAENRKQGISLIVAGQEETVPDDGYWRGMIEDRRVMIVSSEAQNAPEPGKRYTIGKGQKSKIVTVVSVGEKAVIVDSEGAKKPYPIQLDKWNGVEVTDGQ